MEKAIPIHCQHAYLQIEFNGKRKPSHAQLHIQICVLAYAMFCNYITFNCLEYVKESLSKMYFSSRNIFHFETASSSSTSIWI